MNWDQALRLRHIKCFLQVARVESVSLAAASLNITQPAVSKTIKELEELKAGGIDTEGLIYIAKNCHVITNNHKEEDGKDSTIGTTKRGNGPAYRDKYSRDGFLAQDIPELRPYLIDLHDEFWNHGEVKILCEGAQGFGLDIDWGDYPFV
ncbi:MAG: LysR family transcriptional regulator, partial [Rhodobacteraceae bacterium]|nr:LysR family transcriptional regulator [Paracoccaceae bacterium]